MLISAVFLLKTRIFIYFEDPAVFCQRQRDDLAKIPKKASDLVLKGCDLRIYML